MSLRKLGSPILSGCIAVAVFLGVAWLVAGTPLPGQGWPTAVLVGSS